MIYSSEDFERFYIRYKEEGLPRKETIQGFCLKNKVPFRQFDKWYRDTRHRIVPVEVDGCPEAEDFSAERSMPDSPSMGDTVQRETTTSEDVRIFVEIRMSNGLRMSQRNLSYDGLVRLVTNMRGLC